MTSIKLFLIKFLLKSVYKFNSGEDFDKYIETVRDDIYFLLKEQSHKLNQTSDRYYKCN